MESKGDVKMMMMMGDDSAGHKKRKLDSVCPTPSPTSKMNSLIRSVIRIECDTLEPKYSLPWQMHSPAKGGGTGVLIDGNLILTNAHIVWKSTYITVQHHHHDVTKYEATIKHIDLERDLALLVVHDAKIWAGSSVIDVTNADETPAMPTDDILAVGYITPENSPSVTAGVVARVMSHFYSFSGCRLITVMIDAALNGGNSGGPVFMKNDTQHRFLGLVTEGGSNVGYFIPVSMVKDFVLPITTSKLSAMVPFGRLGIQDSLFAENPSTRKYLQLQDDQHGVIVLRIQPLGMAAANDIRVDDVIMEIDGYPISDDGTYVFRLPSERLDYSHLFSSKRALQQQQQPDAKHTADDDDAATMIIMTWNVLIRRDGQDIKRTLKYTMKLAIQSQYVSIIAGRLTAPALPEYYMYSGIVFMRCTNMFLTDKYGPTWNGVPVDLLKAKHETYREHKDDQLVIISHVLGHKQTACYNVLVCTTVKKVNGHSIKNLKHMIQLIEQSKEPFLRFDLSCFSTMILERATADETRDQLMKAHNIPASRSADLLLL